MSFMRFVLPVLAASFIAAFGSLAAQTPPAPLPPCAGYGGGFGSWLTQEQRLMHFSQMQKATAAMSFADARAYRVAEHQKIMAMTAAERDRFAADLLAKWNALSAEEQQQIRQQFADWRANRPGRGMGMGMGHGGRGMGGGMGGGCWWW